MLTFKDMALYLATAAFSFFIIAMNIQAILFGGYDMGTDLILAFVFPYEAYLLIMVMIKSGRVRKFYDPKHLKFAQKLLRAAETVYTVILLHLLMSFPRLIVFFTMLQESRCGR